MNERTSHLVKNYQPVLALTVYKTENGEGRRGDYYLESHDINEKGEVMQGKPLLQETIEAIVDVFFDERKNKVAISGMIPDNLLNFLLLPGGNYRMVWYRPAEVRVIHFSSILKIETTKAWVPAIVYTVEGRSFSVFALNANTRPKEATKLFMAPFFNVSDSGLVCLGSANVKQPKQKTYMNLMQYWEDLFWLSEFTHVNGNDNKTVTKLQPLWQKVMKSKCKLKWSDLKELKPYPKHSLKQLIK